MTNIDPDELRVGDLITMREIFIVTAVTATHIWAGPVSYSKRSEFPTVERSWQLFPMPLSARPQWPDVDRRCHRSLLAGDRENAGRASVG
jgi:hypothetical protein